VGDNAQGYIEQLPSGRFRAGVYLGKDPITKRSIYLRAAAPDRQQAQIELGKLLEQARAGKEPESGATVGYLLGQYMPLAEWEVSTSPAVATVWTRVLNRG
jgi:hypothetical protein